ncbi:hypothetical protein [Mesorhizobium sp. M0802]|uniref:hypothetical protein n=1 Tax=Mesorhizobium sp. M0802 TaxID=2957001 RepID=UPI00333BFBDB
MRIPSPFLRVARFEFLEVKLQHGSATKTQLQEPCEISACGAMYAVAGTSAVDGNWKLARHQVFSPW